MHGVMDLFNPISNTNAQVSKVLAFSGLKIHVCNYLKNTGQRNSYYYAAIQKYVTTLVSNTHTSLFLKRQVER